MEPEKVLQEIASVFIRHIACNPDTPVALTVRVGQSLLELQYQARPDGEQARVVVKTLQYAKAV